MFNVGSGVPPALRLLRTKSVWVLLLLVLRGVVSNIAAGAVAAVGVAAADCVAVIAAGAAAAVGVAAGRVAVGVAAAEERVGVVGLSGIGSVGCGHLFFFGVCSRRGDRGSLELHAGRVTSARTTE